MIFGNQLYVDDNPEEKSEKSTKKKFFGVQVMNNECEFVDQVLDLQPKYATDAMFSHDPANTPKDLQEFLRDSIMSIHIAAFYDCIESSIVLIKHGAKPDCRSSLNLTPLHYAALGKSLEMASFLLANKVNPDAIDDFGHSPVYYAVQAGSPTMMELLFNGGASTELKKTSGEIAMSIVSLADRAVKSNSMECIIGILKRAPAMNNPGIGELTPLMQAIGNHLYSAIDALLEHGINPNTQNSKGNTGLILAMHSTDKTRVIEVTRSLIRHGANVITANNDGATALHIACENQSLDVITLLHQSGAKIQKRSKSSKTLLQFTLINDPKIFPELLKYLLENGADVNEEDQDGLTILPQVIFDSQRSTPEVIEILLSHGADMTKQALNNMSSFDMVKQMPSSKNGIKKIFNSYAPNFNLQPMDLTN